MKKPTKAEAEFAVKVLKVLLSEHGESVVYSQLLSGFAVPEQAIIAKIRELEGVK